MAKVTPKKKTTQKTEEMWVEWVTEFSIRSQHLESQGSPEPSLGLGLLHEQLPAHLSAPRGRTISSVCVILSVNPHSAVKHCCLFSSFSV